MGGQIYGLLYGRAVGGSALWAFRELADGVTGSSGLPGEAQRCILAGDHTDH